MMTSNELSNFSLCSTEIIDEGPSTIDMTERDADMAFFSRLFRVYKGIFDRHLYVLSFGPFPE